MDATGWQQHTVRFLAGLKKKGLDVTVLERVRQVGPASRRQGSYSIYRIAEAADARGHLPQPRYAVGLYRVSTAEQEQSGLGLEAQQASVRAFADAHGWTLIAGSPTSRPARTITVPAFRQPDALPATRGCLDGGAAGSDHPSGAHAVAAAEEGYRSGCRHAGGDDLMMRIYAAMAQKERN